MPQKTTPWRAGMPCWVDLGTTDVEGARALYGEAFGWEFDDQGEEYGHYNMCRRNDLTVAGIGPVQGANPPAWTLYFATDDVESTARSIADNGGCVLMEPMDIGDAGCMIIASDPDDAV